MVTNKADCTEKAGAERYPGSAFDDELERFARLAFQVVAQARRWDTIQAAGDALARTLSKCRAHVSEQHHLSSQGTGSSVSISEIAEAGLQQRKREKAKP